MANLNPKEKKEIRSMFKKKFNFSRIEFLGYERIVLYERTYLKNEGSKIGIDKVKFLTDQNGNIIPLINEYNGIETFAKGIAVVWIRKNLTHVKDTHGDFFSEERKYGLINKDGNELLPCIYDSIKAHLDGFIEIQKGDQIKATNKQKVIEGKFDWDKAMNILNYEAFDDIEHLVESGVWKKSEDSGFTYDEKRKAYSGLYDLTWFKDPAEEGHENIDQDDEEEDDSFELPLTVYIWDDHTFKLEFDDGLFNLWYGGYETEEEQNAWQKLKELAKEKGLLLE